MTLTPEQLHVLKSVLADLLNKLLSSKQADEVESCVLATIEPMSDRPFLKKPFLVNFHKFLDIPEAVNEQLVIIRKGIPEGREVSKETEKFLHANLTTESKKLIDLFSFFIHLKDLKISEKRAKMLTMIRALYLEIQPKYNKDVYGNVLDDFSFSFIETDGAPLKLTKYGPLPTQGEIQKVVEQEVKEFIALFRSSRKKQEEQRIEKERLGRWHHYFQQASTSMLQATMPYIKVVCLGGDPLIKQAFVDVAVYGVPQRTNEMLGVKPEQIAINNLCFIFTVPKHEECYRVLIPAHMDACDICFLFAEDLQALKEWHVCGQQHTTNDHPVSYYFIKTSDVKQKEFAQMQDYLQQNNIGLLEFPKAVDQRVVWNNLCSVYRAHCEFHALDLDSNFLTYDKQQNQRHRRGCTIS